MMNDETFLNFLVAAANTKSDKFQPSSLAQTRQRRAPEPHEVLFSLSADLPEDEDDDEYNYMEVRCGFFFLSVPGLTCFQDAPFEVDREEFRMDRAVRVSRTNNGFGPLCVLIPLAILREGTLVTHGR
jgi:hypothetical protein